MVRLDRLGRRFGPLLAVEDVSFAVRRGEVLGFLGPNGAGKTTTMRMLTGFLAPSSGRASIMGHDIVARPLEAKRLIGYLPEGAPLYGDMSVMGFLGFVAEMRGIKPRSRAGRIADAIGKASLEDVALRPIETLSKGYKRRVGIAQAIIHDPPVLIMDEPTDGLDPNQKHEIRDLIRAMAPGKAIIVSTHILEEVEAVCTRAMIIAAGRIVADAPPAELKRRSVWQNAVRVTTSPALLPQAAIAVRAAEGVRDVRVLGAVDGAGALLVVPQDGFEIITSITAALHIAGVEPQAITLEEGRLDDVFRTLTTGEPALEARP